MTTGKTIVLTRRTFVGKVTSLLFNMLYRLVIAFLPRSKCLLISWLQSPSAVILEHKKRKSVTVSFVSPSICHEVMGPDATIFALWMLSSFLFFYYFIWFLNLKHCISSKPDFSLSSFTFIRRLFTSFLPSAIIMVSPAYLRLLVFLPAILILALRLPAQHFAWCTLHIS